MLGYHQSFSKPMSCVIDEACGRDTFQIFTRSTRNGRQRYVSETEIDYFNHALLNSKIRSYVIHAPYILNPSSPDVDKRERAVRLIQEDMDFLFNLVGKKYYVLHPGSHKGAGIKQGIKNLADTLKQIATHGVDICVEFMAGGGSELVCTREQLEFARVTLGCYFTFDSAHVFQAGEDPVELYTRYKELFKVVHLNNSATICGSHHDIHANIADGHINPDKLLYLYSRVPPEVPVILETPYAGINDDYNYLKNGS